ncbi:Gamma-glutamylputrescine synthetase PuuA [Betaproteobacteria bacterium MOLA814]|nr:Gamma-glutamylputrescine synthetase PuuA [Betaproteobacteria bacterium MOLA814]
MNPSFKLTLPDTVERVECVLADFTSMARGKTVGVADFQSMQGCRMSSAVLGVTLTTGVPSDVMGPIVPTNFTDLHMVADMSTCTLRPGRPQEATVICDSMGVLHTAANGEHIAATDLSPRSALKQVLTRLDTMGLQATVAPELEFFLLSRNTGDNSIHSATTHPVVAASPWPGAPVGEVFTECNSVERCAGFDAFFDDLYAGCNTLGIPATGHAHEASFSQFELNFAPGPVLAQADAVFRCKRLVREVAAQHGFIGSFAPKPIDDDPGCGMHWHISLQHTDGRAWPHVFANEQGDSAPELQHFIAGMQRQTHSAMAIFAPYDMSYERINHSDANPTHATVGEEDRGVALRVPLSSAAARRVENRLPGGDSNPYLTLAAMLGSGIDGLEEGQQHNLHVIPNDHTEALRLPSNLPQALDALRASADMRRHLGSHLVDAYVGIKRHEHAERAALANPRLEWDFRHLLHLA